jgi:hypothetical protein
MQPISKIDYPVRHGNKFKREEKERRGAMLSLASTKQKEQHRLWSGVEALSQQQEARMQQASGNEDSKCLVHNSFNPDIFINQYNGIVYASTPQSSGQEWANGHGRTLLGRRHHNPRIL